MKLKIVHQNQETREAPEQQQPTAMKEEPVEAGEQETNDVDPPPQMNSAPISDAILSGKRKRKPKELIDSVPTIVLTKSKRKTKKSSGIVGNNVKSSDPKMNNRTPNTGGASSSKVDNPAQMKTPTLIQAEAVQASLGNEQPTFLKVLVRSHVGSCFWMGLPVPFCKMHLPSTDTTVTVEDENGEEFPVKYIAHKTGLSAGWRRFVSANKLVEGDVLVFQLTAPSRLKVYIMRSHDMNEVDGALSLLILDSQTKQNDAGKQDSQNKRKRRPKSLPLTVVHKRNLKEEGEEYDEKPDGEQSGNDSNEVDSEVLEGSKLSKSCLNFKDVKSFEDFHIVVNGLCIDSELPEETRRDYYDLCRSRNSFLHSRVLPGLYSKLAAGMIVEFVTITKAIRGCKVTTPKKDFEVWENSLRSFELLGLNVGFVRSRLHELMKMAYETEGGLQVRKYLEARKEKSCTEEEIVKLEMKLVELKEMSVKYGRRLESLKPKAESYELEFLEAVNEPW